ncbi:8-oxo-dGTP diphosphatase [Paenibacillus sp. SC116]|uniref:8-oxo-dGTP diphosphatase n=1 Tax=Paenibacillus sp. SC116 TaxID=2968986 RepID=UPI00215B473B|nr:8-oxo-dGTP diphosphatase [Paenibacillus sp. SC116]MCR8843866.1 8-oxo-dGTP diphosphatase [Paenibacillus sp. SC116]
MKVNHELYTMCMIEKDDKVLLINRPTKRGFPGYIAPGGKVDYPESIVDGAIREVREETGLIVTDIIYKGLAEYCEPETGLRSMVFNYLATSFEGELLEHPPEGELLWIEKDKALELPMQDWFRSRFPLFFQLGTFEISLVWDKEHQAAINSIEKYYVERVMST